MHDDDSLTGLDKAGRAPASREPAEELELPPRPANMKRQEEKT